MSAGDFGGKFLIGNIVDRQRVLEIDFETEEDLDLDSEPLSTQTDVSILIE